MKQLLYNFFNIMTNFFVFVKYLTYIASAGLYILKNSCNFALR